MGYPKLRSPEMVPPPRVVRPAADTISLTARRLARPKSQPKPHISGADQMALSRIAERFAPGAPDAQLEAAPEDVAPKQAPPKDRPLHQQIFAAASAPGMRVLIAVFLVIALLPSVTLGAMLWLGAIDTPWSPSARADTNPLAAGKSTLAAATPIPDQPQSNQAAAIGPLALTSPDTLEAKAGGEAPFDIALDHSGELPARSVIAVAGLPQGATLSAGRPYGEAEWNLKSDEIGDLRIILPDTASGESTLRVKLVAADGEILAGTETVLEVTPDPEAALATRPPLGAPPSDAQEVYDPNLAGVAAFDADNQQLLGASGVEEIFTTPEAPPPPAYVASSKGAAGDAQVAGDAKAADDTKAADDEAKAWVAPEFVNLRKGPTSSADVITIVAKGTKLSVTGRKRGWVQVTDPGTSQSGWIYAGSKRRKKATEDGDGSSTSFWPSLGSLLGSSD
jgi:Bacterial SH3 domain